MEHPFVQNLSDKSLDELQNTISQLNNKLTFAYRTNNLAMIRQLLMVLESYRSEYNKKMAELMDKQKISSKINISKDKV